MQTSGSLGSAKRIRLLDFELVVLLKGSPKTGPRISRYTVPFCTEISTIMRPHQRTARLNRAISYGVPAPKQVLFVSFAGIVLEDQMTTNSPTGEDYRVRQEKTN
jgi:hypothetical protein